MVRVRGFFACSFEDFLIIVETSEYVRHCEMLLEIIDLEGAVNEWCLYNAIYL